MDEMTQDTLWVEVYTTREMTKVPLVESLLSSERIPLRVDGELTNQVFGGAIGVTEGVSILVPQPHEAEALVLLCSAGYIPVADTEGVESVLLRGRSGKSLSLSRLVWTVIAAMVLVLVALGTYVYILTA